MKYLKLFEELEDTPKIGDYVICKVGTFYTVRNFKNFYLQTIIGKIVSIQIMKDEGKINYAIKYDEGDIPEEFEVFFKSYRKDLDYIRWQNSKDIIFWSENKEDVEAYLAAKKYNL